MAITITAHLEEARRRRGRCRRVIFPGRRRDSGGENFDVVVIDVAGVIAGVAVAVAAAAVVVGVVGQ